MKSIFKRFAGGALAALAILLVSACDSPVGAKGIDGLNSYLVVFNFNDGATMPHAAGVVHGDRATAPDNLLILGDEQNGWAVQAVTAWYVDKAKTNKWNFSTPVTKNITLYAQLATLQGEWISEPYKEEFTITANEFTNSWLFKGDIVNIRSLSADSGYITTRFTEILVDEIEDPDSHDDLGRFYVTHFENLTKDSVDISMAGFWDGREEPDFAYPERLGGKKTQAAAEAAYTLEENAFRLHSYCFK